jgi:hypothetical protein
VTAVDPQPPDAPGNGQPAARSPHPAPPAVAPPPQDDEQRLAERRVLEEMSRHRRAERQQLAAFRWGCIGILIAMVLLMAIGFLLS